ncbi:hypothetical protein [Actinomadura sp. WMMB 499]
MGLPKDVAAACAHLVRDEAGYITGRVIGINGGRTTCERVTAGPPGPGG